MLSFTGFLVSFMMRTDINIAMVAMVKMPPPNLGELSGNDSNAVPATAPAEPRYCYVAPAAPALEDNRTASMPEVRASVRSQ